MLILLFKISIIIKLLKFKRNYPCKMEKLPQPAQLNDYLRQYHQRDSYNKFCVDCNKNESTHASVTYGILLCAECAEIHRNEFGMDQSYIKSLFEELWDDYQVKCMELGGNKPFWDFMKAYNAEWKSIQDKYKSRAAKYYKRRLSALAQEREFTEEAPAKNIEEVLGRGVGTAKGIANKAEDGLSKFGTFISGKFQQSGVKEKFTGMFNKNN